MFRLALSGLVLVEIVEGETVATDNIELRKVPNDRVWQLYR